VHDLEVMARSLACEDNSSSSSSADSSEFKLNSTKQVMLTVTNICVTEVQNRSKHSICARHYR
jgi:hypothetical protein